MKSCADHQCPNPHVQYVQATSFRFLVTYWITCPMVIWPCPMSPLKYPLLLSMMTAQLHHCWLCPLPPDDQPHPFQIQTNKLGIFRQYTHNPTYHPRDKGRLDLICNFPCSDAPPPLVDPEAIYKVSQPAVKEFAPFSNYTTAVFMAALLQIDPHFLFLYFLYFLSCHVIVMWSLCDLLSCDIYCSVMSIVLWPIVQGDSIVPVTPIVLVTLLFSFTISTSSLWPYSLRPDFLYLMVLRAIRALFPTHPLPLFPFKVFTLRPLIA